jgi:hypothetical protein
LKPGGHLLAFAGTRTQHRMAVRIEDAGFEIRDMIAWVYGSGFPKSLDVSKEIDKMDAADEQMQRRYRFTEWVRATGATSRQINEATGTNMGGHYTTAVSQPAIMTREHLEQCRHLLGDVPEWVEREADIRSVESRNFAEREVVGVSKNAMSGWRSDGSTKYKDRGITAPATPEAQHWAGWGTALKPALEPITMARKPLAGTVAANVLEHGTGALNVDGCRVEGGLIASAGGTRRSNGIMGASEPLGGWEPTHSGRWPANLIHDGSDEVMTLFPMTESGSRRAGKHRVAGGQGRYGEFAVGEFPEIVGDSGSAARFFYCAKASKADRDEGLEGMPVRSEAWFQTGNGASGKPSSIEVSKGPRAPRANNHPTVKPTDLMRYLCRLVTPPGGTVLDPFAGSGSTGKAAALEGFRFIGIEREAEYVEIARARIAAAVARAGLFERTAS